MLNPMTSHVILLFKSVHVTELYYCYCSLLLYLLEVLIILAYNNFTADKGWSSSLGVGRGANNSSPYEITMLQNAVCTKPVNIVQDNFHF
jgi:hypothetical protein